MNDVLYDLGYFIQSLSLYDFLFLLSVLVLIIMLTSLVYIFKISQSDDDFVDNDDDKNDIDNKKEEIDNNKKEEKNNDNDNNSDNELDLLKISKEIDENKSPIISLNDYEREQEEKAIISYDELLAAAKEKDEQINYKNEENINGLTIKAVDLEMFNTRPIELPRKKNELVVLENENEINKEEVTQEESSPPVLISYEKQEDFLQTLKQLQELLN